MASLSWQGKSALIQFKDKDGNRQSVCPGVINKKDAAVLKNRVEDLVAASITGCTPKPETVNWIAGCGDGLLKKLAKVGLVERSTSSTLAEFIDSYIESRTDVKPSTLITYNNARRNLVDFFGPDKRLTDITKLDAKKWSRSLGTDLADNTVRLRCRTAKLFFRAAVDDRVIANNPFQELVSTTRPNHTRAYFVAREEAEQVLEACPDAEWRLIFALARYGGLRCPSELLALKWADINWDKETFVVHSPKTERDVNKAQRVCPLFWELAPYLRDAYELAEPGTAYVITRYRQSSVNLRQQLTRIIKRAGLKPWPKLFQNLRSTRATELFREHTKHSVNDWLGHTEEVADRYYRQTTADDYRKAVTPPKLAYILQHPPALDRTEPRTGKQNPCSEAGNGDMHGGAGRCKDHSLGLPGLEPGTKRL